MINNNKGAILLVTIVSMMILTIIGYITLQMTASQGVADTYDQARMRVGYAAEGIVERARGYIEYIVANSTEPKSPGNTRYGDVGDYPPGSGFVNSRVRRAFDTRSDGRWYLFDGVVDSKNHHYGVNGYYDLDHIAFDNSMYPEIHVTVWCQIATETIRGITSSGGDYSPRSFSGSGPGNNKQTCKIVGVASATVNASGIGVIVSTVTYYFNTEHTVDNDEDGVEFHDTNYLFVGWRKEL